ncbi:tetratricopeptide repeat protein [Paenibacillus solisilvae]|uniref:Tetratricopeptide repeat protein n=1 Tax=Paenibacillus solisilvae TaxID=2486751 RepID=A0ABW0VZA8_9BACL
MDGESSLKKAYEAILSGDFEQAIARFEDAIEQDPDNAAPYYRCSITCARSGKWQKALLYAEKAVELDSEQEEYAFHLQTVQAKQLVIEAESLFMAQTSLSSEQALDKLQEASKLDPLNLDALLLLGAAYASLNRLDEAASCALEAIRLDPEHSAARRLLADMNRRRRALRASKKRR